MRDKARDVPAALRDAVASWRLAGQHAQRGSSWSLRSWEQWFPERSEFLASLPNPIDRDSVSDVCRSAGDGPDEAVRGFLAAMIWGYGTVGYGAFRTARVLRDNDGAAERLAKLASLARHDGGPSAFDWLAANRLHGLGVAFATKFLFFCAATGAATPALVLDQLVRDWLAEHAQWSLRLDWRVEDYRAYVETVCTWAAELNLTPANVEMLMFTLAVNSRSSQWSQPKLLEAPPPQPVDEGLEPEVREVIDALDEAVDAFAALPGVTAPEDYEDFRRGVRHLRQIVLARRPG